MTCSGLNNPIGNELELKPWLKNRKYSNPKPVSHAATRYAGVELAFQKPMPQKFPVYESYGFDALDTSAFEHADALGKFLPDDDRSNEGVFSFEDDDGQWLSMP